MQRARLPGLGSDTVSAQSTEQRLVRILPNVSASYKLCINVSVDLVHCMFHWILTRESGDWILSVLHMTADKLVTLELDVTDTMELPTVWFAASVIRYNWECRQEETRLPSLGLNLPRDQSQLPEREQSKLPERDQSQLPERDQSQHPERDQSQLPERDQSQLPGRDQSQLSEREQSQHPERDQSQHLERDQSQHPERDQSQHQVPLCGCDSLELEVEIIFL